MKASGRLRRLDVIALQRIINLLIKTEREADFYEPWQEMIARQDAAIAEAVRIF